VFLSPERLEDVRIGFKQRYKWLILAIMALSYFQVQFHRISPSPLIPILMDELGLTYAVAGLLSSAFFICYTSMQIPTGVLIETMGVKKIVLSFMALFTGGAVLFSQGRDVGTLLAARVIMGLGSSVIWVSTLKLISMWFPTEKRATATGLANSAGGIGSFMAYIVLPFLSATMGGWHTPYLAISSMLLITMALLAIFLKDAPTGMGSHADSSHGNWSVVKENIRDVLAVKELRPFILASLIGGVGWALILWMPKFLMDVRQLSYVDANLVSSSITVAMIPGGASIGFISDRLRKRKPPLVWGSIISAILLSIFVALPTGTSYVVMGFVGFAVGLFWSTWILGFSMVSEILPRKVLGTGLGIYNMCNFVSSIFAAPLLGGLVDWTHTYAAPILLALSTLAIQILIFICLVKETYLWNASLIGR
jgi:sugar phosphate permease